MSLAESADLIGWDEVHRLVGYCRMQVDRLEKVGAFPKRLKLGNGRGGRVTDHASTTPGFDDRQPAPCQPGIHAHDAHCPLQLQDVQVPNSCSIA